LFLGYLFVKRNFRDRREIDWRNLAWLNEKGSTNGGEIHSVVLLNEGIVVGISAVHKVIFLFCL